MVILSFIFGVVVTFFALGIVTHCKDTQPKNNVHFYVARDKDKTLWLYLEKPIKDEDCDRYIPHRCGNVIIGEDRFKDINLNPNDFKNLSFDDNPVEIFLNLED